MSTHTSSGDLLLPEKHRSSYEIRSLFLTLFGRGSVTPSGPGVLRLAGRLGARTCCSLLMVSSWCPRGGRHPAVRDHGG
ncbi:hypothetical protein ACRAWF_43765 [Streptomyces sp. L7]